MDTTPGHGELNTGLDLSSLRVWATIYYLDSPSDYKEHIQDGSISSFGTSDEHSNAGNRACSAWIYFGAAVFAVVVLIGLVFLVAMCF